MEVLPTKNREIKAREKEGNLKLAKQHPGTVNFVYDAKSTKKKFDK